MRRRDLLRSSFLLPASESLLAAQETRPVGDAPSDQQRNALLLADYDYKKYATSLTGYTGQDRQRIAFVHYRHAVRTRVGPRGNYKAGMAQLPNGKLVIAVCRDNNNPERTKRNFAIFVYESSDEALTWEQIGRTPVFGKEPSLTALRDGSLLLTAQKGYFGPGAMLDEIPNRARQTAAGRGKPGCFRGVTIREI